MENTNNSSAKSRTTVTLPKEMTDKWKERAEANFRDLSGELQCIFTDLFNKKNDERATNSD